MKLFLAVLLTCVIAVSAFKKVSLRELLGKREPNPAPEAIVPKTVVLNQIEQHVDNFDTQNHATWNQVSILHYITCY